MEKNQSVERRLQPHSSIPVKDAINANPQQNMQPNVSPRSVRPTLAATRFLATCSFLASFVIAGLLAIFSIQQGVQYLTENGSGGIPRSLMMVQDLDSSQPSGEQIGIGAAKASGLKLKDFAAAFPTDSNHQEYIRYSRAWRQGLYSYVATNQNLEISHRFKTWTTHKEMWGYYPDDHPLHTLALKGDSRAALAPFLAARDMTQGFKWMLYGDDDTFFFMDAVQKVVKDLDPEMPYFLTDHMWWTAKWKDANGNPGEESHHPHSEAPLCVPCNYTGNTSTLDFHYPVGCPCRPADLCAADHKGLMFKGPNGLCGMPRVPVRTFSMHGGAGAILSVGLLKSIKFEDFEACVTTTYTTGGDAAISICLWQMGYGMTTPDPLWHPQGLSMFDVGGIAQGDRDDIIDKVAIPFGNLLEAAAGYCQHDPCKAELDHFVTLHMRSRKFSSKMCFEEVTRALANLGNLANGRPLYTPHTKNTTLAVQYNKGNDDLQLAIKLYKEHRICADIRPLDREHLEQCHKAQLHSLSNPGQIFARRLGNLREARTIAKNYLQLQYERFPSPTGTFGFIPVGRE